MKKSLLFAMAILGFTSLSSADPNLKTLVCNDGDFPYLSAFLILGTDMGTEAYLIDNYDTSRNEDPSSNVNSKMTCNEVGESIECLGRWGIAKSSTKVVFTRDAGKVSATFNRSQIWDNEVVTFPCHLKEQLP